MGVSNCPNNEAESLVTIATAHVRFRSAGSTGRCNAVSKSLSWGFKPQALTWSFV
jgi:hypothetical protein